MHSVEVVVVGAGVVGLAVARAVALAGHEVLVLEQHSRTGQETSSRNSGVIHSGIYYPTGSLKARLCVLGRERLYAYCDSRSIAYQRCGKIIVARAEQMPGLEALHRQAIANGVDDLKWLTADHVRSLEPEVQCDAGLLCPSTGIIDVHELLLALQGDLEDAAGLVVLHTRLEGARTQRQGFHLRVTSDGAPSDLHCRWLINCAGLSATDVLARLDGYPPSRRRRAFFAKGNYFSCQGLRPFKRLVYPMPNTAGLGIHATLDLDGTTRFGPDVEWVDEMDYRVDAYRERSFYEAIREYWPAIPSGCLQPAYAGIRPKLVGPGAAPADFEIEGPAQHGISSLINLLGIESPGLTSSLALAQYVAALVD